MDVMVRFQAGDCKGDRNVSVWKLPPRHLKTMRRKRETKRKRQDCKNEMRKKDVCEEV